MMFTDKTKERANQIISLPMHVLYKIIHDRVSYIREPYDPDAVAQNACVEIEKHAGIFPNINGSVLQEWTRKLTRMQQTVLLTAVRGPDGLPKYGGVKMLVRWYRRCILMSSLDNCVLMTPFDKRGGSFMGPSYDGHSNEHLGRTWMASMNDVLSMYLKELDAIPHHFQLHLMHAFEIVGYKHPDQTIRIWFNDAYRRLVYDMHLEPETEERLDFRLSDNRDNWLSTADIATQD
jgi:hypothetical protein